MGWSSGEADKRADLGLAMFLATTALSEFWDKKQEILFLGRACLLQDRKEEWEALDYQVMPSPWDDRSRFDESVKYLDELGERMLDCMTSYLNDVHGIRHSKRYWRIVIGPWLLHHVHTVFDRYIHLKESFYRFPNLQTLVLDPGSFQVPRDIVDWVNWICGDLYNLQIYSQLIAGIGYTFPEKAMSARRFVPRKVRLRAWWEGLVKDQFRNGLNLLGQAIRSTVGPDENVALCDLSFSRRLTWELVK